MIQIVITANIWDKKTSINGKSSNFISEHFKKENGNDDRILIYYDGVLMQIKYIDDFFFDNFEKKYMQDLIDNGFEKEQAILETWLKKIQEQEDNSICLNEKIDNIDKIIQKDVLMEFDIDYTKPLDEIKNLAILKTKIWISKELEKGIEFNNKIYSVTMEKQNLLSSQLALFVMNSQFEIPMQLTWNASGEPCTVWEFSDLLMLSNAMAMHVAPLIKNQQIAEVMIKETDNIEIIKEIMLDFE